MHVLQTEAQLHKPVQDGVLRQRGALALLEQAVQVSCGWECARCVRGVLVGGWGRVLLGVGGGKGAGLAKAHRVQVSVWAREKRRVCEHSSSLHGWAQAQEDRSAHPRVVWGRLQGWRTGSR